MAAVAVDGLYVAKADTDLASTFDYRGQPVVIRPTQGKLLGTILRKGHPFLRMHPNLFEPLTLEPEYDHLAP